MLRFSFSAELEIISEVTPLVGHDTAGLLASGCSVSEGG